jgi:Concanavalin A-like lectin/glucanases superfamily
MGTRYNPGIVTRGLVLCLDAANPKSYTGSSAAWYDISGNRNHCVWTSAPTWSNGLYTFDGLANYGTITNNATLNFASNMTLMILMHSTATSGRRNPWDQAYGGYGTWTDEPGGSVNSYFGDAGSNTTPYAGRTITFPKNTWGLLCTARDTTYHNSYKNGTLIENYAHGYGDLTTTSANIRVGQGYAGYYQGYISIILAYASTLTQEEVNQNYAALRGRYTL